MFEQEILAHLHAHGPQPYDALYILLYALRTVQRQIILYELHLWNLIEIAKDTPRTVSITAAGLARLAELNPPPSPGTATRMKIV